MKTIKLLKVDYLSLNLNFQYKYEYEYDDTFKNALKRKLVAQMGSL